MSKHILLADDSITIQKVVELTFSADQGYRVTSVSGGNQALAKLRESRPDLILCDVIMPEKNGYEVTEALKSNPATRGIPLILLSGTFEPFDEDRARRAGADAWITKPFESQALVALVEEHLAKRVTLADSGSGAPGAVVGASPSTGFGKAPNPDQAINFAPATPNPATTAAMPPLSPRITHPPVAAAPPPAPISPTAVTASMAPITEIPPAPTGVEQRRQAVTQDMISHSEPSPVETLPMPDPTPALRSTAPWAPLPPAPAVEPAPEPEPEFGAGTMQMMIGGAGPKPWEKPAELPPPPVAAFSPPEIRPSQLLEETHRKVDDLPPAAAMRTQPFMAEVAPEPPPAPAPAYVPQSQRPVSPTERTETLPTLSSPPESVAPAPPPAPAWLAAEAPAEPAPAPAASWLAPEPAPVAAPEPAAPSAPAWLAPEPAPAPTPEPAPEAPAPAWLAPAAPETPAPAWLAAEAAPEPEPPPAFAEPVAEPSAPPVAEPPPEPAPAAMPWLSSPPPADLPPTAELASPPDEAFQPPSVRPSQLLEETKRKVESPAPPPPPEPAPEPAPVFAVPEPVAPSPEPPLMAASVAASPTPPAANPAAPEPELAAAPASGEISDELVERIARKIVELYGDKVLREVAWEVIPDLAEMIIRNRINELEAEADKDGKPS